MTSKPERTERQTRQSASRFRRWLLEELRLRNWSHYDVAREINVDRSTVTKWLMPYGHPSWRRPSYQHVAALADRLGIDTDNVLELAGLKEPSGSLTVIQRDIALLVAHIPDDLLIPVYYQLRALAERDVQCLIGRRRAELDGADPVDDEPLDPDPDESPGDSPSSAPRSNGRRAKADT